jgi:PAS domain S-box-containing protein
MFGFTCDEALGHSLNDLIVPSDKTEEEQQIQRDALQREIAMYESVRRRKDGSLMHVSVSTKAIRGGNNGEVQYFLSTKKDVTQRKRAGERMKAILESALDCIVTVDHQGRVVEFNPAAEETFGYRREEAIGQLVAELIIPPSSRERHQRALALLAAGEGPILGKRIESIVMHRDGAEFPAELAITRIGSLEPPMFTEFIHDITQRKRVEEGLLEAHKQLQYLLTHTPAVLYVLKIKGQSIVPVLISGNVERLLGVTVAEAMREEWWRESLHPEDRARAVGILTDALRGDGYSMEYQIRHKDGTYHYVEDRCRIVRDADGEPQQMVGVWTDITQRKRTEERLREQADIIERAQDAIVARDFATDRITVWNSGAERLYGWSASEAIGQPMGELVSEDQPGREKRREQLVATGEFHGEIKHRAKDGRELIVDARVNLIRNDDATPRSVVGINTDVTEQKKLEKQVLRTQRLESIGTLASGVAHDLNNILVPILMAAPFLRGEPSKEERENFLNIIETSAQRGANIVKQVLTFARGASGDRIPLQPIHLLEEIAKIAKETFPTSVRVRTSYPEDLRQVVGDPTQLHQVLLNLCVNARDAMAEGGTLSLTAENFEVDEQYATMMPGGKSGPHIRICVADTGTGIPQHIIDKIFDPFFTTKEPGEGTGLGLSTALGIVKSHGGVISVYSTGAGTTFRVLLPGATDLTRTEEANAQGELPAGHGQTILIVDDEAPIREVAKAVLCKRGYRVLTADDGPAALAHFVQQGNEIDLVLTDLVMPIMSGLVLTRTLRQMDAKAKVILSSGRDGDYNPSALRDIGVQECLIKPYTQEALLRMVDCVLQNDV